MMGHELNGHEAALGTGISLASLAIAYAAESFPPLRDLALCAATFSGVAAGVYHVILIVEKLKAKKAAGG